MLPRLIGRGLCHGVVIDLVALLTMGLVCALAPTGLAAADGYSLEVGSNQLVSVSGAAPSLKDLVIELCDKAEVELLAFGAADRAVSLSYRDLALPELLARLLRSENYMVGLRGSTVDGRARIAWLRVMGENDSGPIASTLSPQAAEARRSAQRSPNVSTGFIVNLFASAGDPERRQQAVRSARALLESKSSSEKYAFLRADPGELARRLAAYPGARELMVDLRSGKYDYMVHIRLGLLSEALDRELAAQDKQP